jgi:sterol desaturase/sphingolipid hydroxylase (fatty acid hydroxylase superfamily)
MIQYSIDFVFRFLTESPLKTWAAFFVVGAVVELVVTPAQKYTSTNTWINIRYGVIYALAIFLLTPGLAITTNYILQRTGAGFIDLDFFSHESIPGQIGAAIVLVLVTDFFYYWLHRAQHTYGWLWEQHALHHSDEALNISTTVRHHWLEFVFQGLAVALPILIIFKLTPVSMWAVATFAAAYTRFNHMNLRLGFGPLSWLACSPQLHRIHHSSLPQHHDRNFAAYFPLWDVIFGTYYAPAKNEYPPTGIDGVRIASVTEATLYPFKRWIAAVAVKIERRSDI